MVSSGEECGADGSCGVVIASWRLLRLDNSTTPRNRKAPSVQAPFTTFLAAWSVCVCHCLQLSLVASSLRWQLCARSAACLLGVPSEMFDRRETRANVYEFMRMI